MGWISVRDSLPKLFTEVLITVRNRCTDFSNTYYGQRGNNYWQFWDYSKILEITDEDENYEVLAWMSLPQPFNERSKNNERRNNETFT